jgi:general secretion pathway protein G
MSRERLLQQAAFTLVELMVVIVIIAILAGVVVPNYIGRVEKAQEVAIKYDMRQISNAIDFFYGDVRRYPESLEELYTQPADEGWHGPYLKTPAKDPWKRDYIYERGSDSSVPFTLKCLGADGKDGGEGEDKDYSSDESLTEQGK